MTTPSQAAAERTSSGTQPAGLTHAPAAAAADTTAELKQAAAAQGFALIGVTPAAAPPGLARFDEWLAAGFAGEMHYLAGRREAYEHPQSVLPAVRSVVLLAMNYLHEEPADAGPGTARISRYAWGDDYHDLIRARLAALTGWLRARHPGVAVRGVVDTAPLLEREYAQLAGLGWIGKNTLLLNRQLGSWFFLAALLTDLELTYDGAFTADHCGTCRACLDACPTGAFAAPYVLDARRCISYLTIELQGPIPRELRPGVGNWLFGCDVCQDVCPWNRRAPHGSEPSLAPREAANPVELAALFELDESAFRSRFRDTPLWRARRRGLLRNAAVVLGNQASPAGLAALQRALWDSEPLVRGAAAWAVGCIGLAHLAERSVAAQRLSERAASETDADVLQEIRAALSALAAG